YFYIKAIKESKGTRKQQSLILAICSIAGLSSSVVTFFTKVTTGIDWSLYFLIFVSYIIIYAVFRLELFDLQPKAYRHAFEINTLPLLILNEQRELVAWNDNADEFINQDQNQKPYLHMSIDSLFASNRDMLSAIREMQPFSFVKDNKHYILETIPLESPVGKKPRGYLLKFNEITSFIDRIAKLEYQASHDELTRILNRRSFHEKAKSYISDNMDRRKMFSVIYMDIDDFKSVNDTYSHMAGDYVLKTFAETISEILPENSLFCRYGGEEFVIMLEDIPKEKAIEMAQNIRLVAMKKKYVFDGKTINFKVSLGLYHHDGATPMDIYDMVFLADKALYQSKNTGKNKLTVYNNESQQSSQ
ncbi:MAG TPA: diguanylate cyclase, partial [Candidatus Izemoplasmatales bacterium]|nr:diguanylate cyclase [Candidatus Izemoplasmatales bacterium]